MDECSLLHESTEDYGAKRSEYGTENGNENAESNPPFGAPEVELGVDQDALNRGRERCAMIDVCAFHIPVPVLYSVFVFFRGLFWPIQAMRSLTLDEPQSAQ